MNSGAAGMPARAASSATARSPGDEKSKLAFEGSRARQAEDIFVRLQHIARWIVPRSPGIAVDEIVSEALVRYLSRDRVFQGEVSRSFASLVRSVVADQMRKSRIEQVDHR